MKSLKPFGNGTFRRSRHQKKIPPAKQNPIRQVIQRAQLFRRKHVKVTLAKVDV